MPIQLPDFLPGRLAIERGFARDYRELAQFHYVAKHPATWADVWVVRYFSESATSTTEPKARIVAVGVLSYPVPSCRARERHFGRAGLTRDENLVFANQNIRTISRVVVHPQFRSLGLSTALVRQLCGSCTTRYVEAMAMMARAHPFFERAGMQRVEPQSKDEPVYFVLDRMAK